MPQAIDVFQGAESLKRVRHSRLGTGDIACHGEARAPAANMFV